MRKLFLILTCLGMLFVSPASHGGLLEKPIPAPDISTTGEWLNSAPLTAKDIKGKVALVDFWTYSCINCLRTLPYIKSWYQQYKDKGFVVIGVHAPEFDFEKNKANVEKAIKRFEITYPVVQDNDHLLWKRFSNQYWPAHYLINKNGKIIYTHFGEGQYDATEKAIRDALNETGEKAILNGSVEGFSTNQTPETYLGTARSERLVKAWDDLAGDNWTLVGDWKRTSEYSEAKVEGASLKIHFRGGKVFLVLGTADSKPINARILFDGKPATDVAGKDVKDGEVTVTDHRLYELIDLKKNSEGVLEVSATLPGLRAYAFTFGSSF
ncbi:MAG: thioredoxin family protein [Alphaproteobacteria bacterium]|nr:thioredoxin family protein [Alphaproteobacteria bacterium]